MRESIETVVVGGGQAGLVMSHCLRERGLEHVVLERSRVAERWRTDRWDSLRFQFPNWTLRLPGFAYQGPDPHAFATRDDVSTFIVDYARHIDAPLRCGVSVTRVAASPRGGFLVEHPGGTLEARNVVIATAAAASPISSPSSTCCSGPARWRTPASAPRVPDARRSRRWPGCSRRRLPEVCYNWQLSPRTGRSDRASLIAGPSGCSLAW